MKVKDCMCNHVNFVKPETTIRDCAKMMCECHIGCTPVCDDTNKLVGIVTDRDIILRSVACGKDSKNTKASEIMTCNTTCCDCNEEISEVTKNMGKTGVRRVPVTKDRYTSWNINIRRFSKASRYKLRLCRKNI